MNQQTPSPLERIKSELGRMTDAQKKIADYISQNTLDAAFMGIDRLSTEVGTSTTTVMRLMSVLGYSGYSDFQKQLQDELRSVYHPVGRLSRNVRTQKDSEDNIWNKVYQEQLDSIYNTFHVIPSDTLNRTVESLHNADRVYFVTSRGGYPVIQYFYLFLSRLRNGCSLISSEERICWSAMIGDIRQDDVVVTSSYPRYSASLVQFAHYAKKQGATVILLTDSYRCPVSSEADIILLCSCASSGFQNSPVTALMLADSILSVFSTRYSEESRKRLTEASRIADELGLYSLGG